MLTVTLFDHYLSFFLKLVIIELRLSVKMWCSWDLKSFCFHSIVWTTEIELLRFLLCLRVLNAWMVNLWKSYEDQIISDIWSSPGSRQGRNLQPSWCNNLETVKKGLAATLILGKMPVFGSWICSDFMFNGRYSNKWTCPADFFRPDIVNHVLYEWWKALRLVEFEKFVQ